VKTNQFEGQDVMKTLPKMALDNTPPALWLRVVRRMGSAFGGDVPQPQPRQSLRVDRARKGHIALVGAGPGARDLLTLRAVNRLGRADVVFYDRLVEPEVLDLIPPHARRVFVGKHVGAHSWPQEQINQVIVQEALQGQRVVRLKSGDPGVFGRASEEMQAARDAGIEVELVSGITAASAAAAVMGRSLTDRGVANTLILATGTGRLENPTPECARLSGPGSTTVMYMSVRQAERIAGQLRERGVPGWAEISIGVEIEKPGQRLLSATVDTLAQVLAVNGVRGCAVLMLTWPEAGFEAKGHEHVQPRTPAIG
jgi:uroporphyrin-III C-methyltransferase/precorrin-2 dehydrogenase/sirohydrochlorin ferrochelatase